MRSLILISQALLCLILVSICLFPPIAKCGDLDNDDDLLLDDDDDDIGLDDDGDIGLDDDDDIGSLGNSDDIGGLDTVDIPTQRNEPKNAVGRNVSFSDGRPFIPVAERTPGNGNRPKMHIKSFVNGVGITMVWCPPGRFIMGSKKTEKRRRADEGPRHWVSFERGFWISAHEISQKQYKFVRGENPSHFKGHDLPVENVTWYEAKRFCDDLQHLETATDGIPEDYNYNLPSEAQWEYACRAGTYSAFNSGPLLSHAIANFGRNRYKHAHFVGRTVRVDWAKPNAFGIFHMHGNVREWCADRYRSSYFSAPADGRAITSGTTTLRVARGGSFGTIAAYCRSAHRAAVEGATRNRYHGFRVVLTPPYGDGLVRLAP